MRLIGICFGHQIIGRALGVPVGRSDIGWEIAVCDINLTEKGKELFGREKLVRPSFPICVVNIAKDFRVLAERTTNA